MADFNIRSDSVDVEQIMKQIRSRIREKRGVDYTEEQIRELASVRLEKFLDPKNLRSDLLEQFRKSRPAPPVIPTEPPPVEPPYVFDDQTLFASHRGAMRFIRKLLRPLLKLMFNPNTLNQVLHAQAQFNVDMMKRDQRRKIEMQMFDRSRAEWNVLYYEVLHNLVLETTRNGIELKNLKMRVEALASRLDFSERRVRALEGVVQYRPEVVSRRDRDRGDRDREREKDRDRDRDRDRDQDRGRDRGPRPQEIEAPTSQPQEPAIAADGAGIATPATPPGGTAPMAGESTGRRRRRRRRGRRGAGPAPAAGGVEPIADGDNNTEGDDEMEGGEEMDAADGQSRSESPDRPADTDGRVAGGPDDASNAPPAPSDPDQQ
jgi:hypothetical protein